MTEASDAVGLCDEPVLDTAHLARVTLQDPELRREILSLFRREAADAVLRLARADTIENWIIAAHTLKGSSRSVGALALAAAADRVERDALPDGPDRRAAALAAIDQAVAAVLPLIDRELAA